MDERERLRKAIRDLHGVEATHLRSEPVHDVFPGQTVWEGVVEVFALNGHPKAGLALRVEPGRRTAYVAVLGVRPIKSASDAVRAALAAEADAARAGG